MNVVPKARVTIFRFEFQIETENIQLLQTWLDITRELIPSIIVVYYWEQN